MFGNETSPAGGQFERAGESERWRTLRKCWLAPRRGSRGSAPREPSSPSASPVSIEIPAATGTALTPGRPPDHKAASGSKINCQCATPCPAGIEARSFGRVRAHRGHKPRGERALLSRLPASSRGRHASGRSTCHVDRARRKGIWYTGGKEPHLARAEWARMCFGRLRKYVGVPNLITAWSPR